MKIAYYTSNRTVFPPASGDVAASSWITYNIAAELAKKHEVTVFAPKGSHLPNGKIVDLDLPPLKIDSATENSDWTTKAVLGLKSIHLAKLISQTKNFDIIHLQTEPIYLGMPFVDLIDVPILFTSHNPYHSIEAPIFKYYDGKINFSAISKAQAKSYPLSSDIPVVYNGIDLGEYQFSAGDRGYFLFLGRLVEEKGVLDFLELAKNNSNRKFVLAGRGPLESVVKDASEKLNNLDFVGFVPYKSDRWRELYGGAKALVNTTMCNESFGLVNIEAMAFGTPVIGYDNGALAEIIKDEENGYIISSGKISGLTEAIKKIDSLSPGSYLQMRSDARKTVEESFTAAKMAEGYLSLYEEIIKDFNNKHVR